MVRTSERASLQTPGHLPRTTTQHSERTKTPEGYNYSTEPQTGRHRPFRASVCLAMMGLGVCGGSLAVVDRGFFGALRG